MKYLYEFIGTFFLVFTVGMSVLEPNSVGPMAPLAIGSALAILVYAGASVSGGHYNPAVSFALFLRGKFAGRDLGSYWLMQLLGGAIGAITALYFKGYPEVKALMPDLTKAFLAEFLFTFLLCYVVLNVATTKWAEKNGFFGFAIGFTVVVGAYAVGAISGAAFNPAVALGVAIMHLGLWTNLWIFVVAGFLGASLAALIVNKAEAR